jgi:hypothetical protein
MVATILLSLCLFGLGLWLCGRKKSGYLTLLLFVFGAILALPGLLYALYYAHLFEPASWFLELRISPHSELLAAGIGFFAGVIQRVLAPETPKSKLAVPTLALGIIFIPFLKSFLDPVDLLRLHTNCRGESCLQSTPSTCGPSSAAALLIHYGVPASERDLARDSFTSNSGTEIWYLARALRKRGFQTEIIVQNPREIRPQTSSIAGVALPFGTGHFIAILDHNDDTWVVMDPLQGVVALPDTAFQRAYKFTGVFLGVHPRSDGRSPAARKTEK